MEHLSFNFFLGRHILSGVEFSTVRNPDDEDWGRDARRVLLVLDGVTYEAMEDPNDGYRSCLQYLIVSKQTCRHTFPPHEVTVRIKPKEENPDGWYIGGEDKILQFIDEKTGRIVLEIGTADYNNWYPYFVANWRPEGLAINNPD